MLRKEHHSVMVKNHLAQVLALKIGAARLLTDTKQQRAYFCTTQVQPGRMIRG